MAVSEKEKYFKDRPAWRKWLKKYHAQKNEIWLIYFKKHTGTPTLPYEHAVEEALCFGWIDGKVQTIDSKKYRQRFTPRTKNSPWSALNKRRAQKMIRQKLMTDAGMAQVRLAKKNGQWAKELGTASKKSLVVPKELNQALKRNNKALRFFKDLAPGYRKNYIAWILDAKRQETRMKRIKATVKSLEAGKKSFI